VTEVSIRVNDDGVTAVNEPAAEPAGTATVESYEIEDGVVFYDAENPLAWVETTRTLSLAEQA